jgi:hypothetical protein
VGPAANAEELVCAFTRVREAYAGSVRAVHGFPIPLQGTHSEVLVRSLLDIEHWFAEIDRKRTNSLPASSSFFIANWLKISDQKEHSLGSQREHSTYGTARIPYSTPHSFFSLDKGVFTSPGWEDVATHLPTLKEEDEKNFWG